MTEPSPKQLQEQDSQPSLATDQDPSQKQREIKGFVEQHLCSIVMLVVLLGLSIVAIRGVDLLRADTESQIDQAHQELIRETDSKPPEGEHDESAATENTLDQTVETAESEHQSASSYGQSVHIPLSQAGARSRGSALSREVAISKPAAKPGSKRSQEHIDATSETETQASDNDLLGPQDQFLDDDEPADNWALRNRNTVAIGNGRN